MSRRVRRIAALCLLLWGLPTPAAAHPGGQVDATNYRSTVIDVVEVNERGLPAATFAGGDVRARIVGPDLQLEVTNTSDEELVVRGYLGEQYLRIGPDGVFENQTAPTTWQNRDRAGETPVPPEATASARPDWVRLGDGPTHRWFDHRAHWTAEAPPVLVTVTDRRAAPARRWLVTMEYDGRLVGVRGRLDWLPGPTWPKAPAVAGAIALLLAAAAGTGGRGRLTGIVGVGALALVIRTVDDLLAVEVTTASAVVTTVGQAVTALAVLGVGVARTRAAHAQADVTLFLGALACAGVAVFGHGAVWTGSQVQTLLPVVVTRGLAAAAAVLPIVVAAWLLVTGTTLRRVVTGAAAVALVAAAVVPSAPRTPRPSAAATCGPVTVVAPVLPPGADTPAVDDPAPAVGADEPEMFGITVRTSDDPYTATQQTAILRAGALVAVHATDVDPAPLRAAALERPRRLAVTPGDVPAGTVVLSAWGVQQRCDADDVRLDRIVAFIDEFAAELPLVPGG